MHHFHRLDVGGKGRFPEAFSILVATCTESTNASNKVFDLHEWLILGLNFQPASKSNVVTILEKARASLPEPSKAPNKAPAAAATAKPAATKAQTDSSVTSGGSGGASGASASSSGSNANKKTKSTAKQAESKVRRIFLTIRCYFISLFFIILCGIQIIHFELEFEIWLYDNQSQWARKYTMHPNNFFCSWSRLRSPQRM